MSILFQEVVVLPSSRTMVLKILLYLLCVCGGGGGGDGVEYGN